jgi:hypothetical protein
MAALRPRARRGDLKARFLLRSPAEQEGDEPDQDADNTQENKPKTDVEDGFNDPAMIKSEDVLRALALNV